MPGITAKRLSDNLLYYADNPPNLPDDDGVSVISNAVRAMGGIGSDWTFTELTQQQYLDMVGQSGRAYLIDGSIVIKELALTSNKAQITADGVDSATLTADTGDASYTGDVRFTVTAPNGNVITEDVACVAGVATTTMTTTQVDMHAVKAECVEFGRDEITVEGI